MMADIEKFYYRLYTFRVMQIGNFNTEVWQRKFKSNQQEYWTQSKGWKWRHVQLVIIINGFCICKVISLKSVTLKSILEISSGSFTDMCRAGKFWNVQTHMYSRRWKKIMLCLLISAQRGAEGRLQGAGEGDFRAMQDALTPACWTGFESQLWFLLLGQLT